MKKNFLIYAQVVICLVAQAKATANDQSEVFEFKAFNGIRFEYSLLLPTNYDRSNSYEIAAVLSEVHVNDKGWEKTMKMLESIELEGTIVIIPKVPVGEEHWGTHPIHHAFNDLLKSVKKSHGNPNQKLHLIGIEAGHETAFWWTAASSKLIASTSIVSGNLWQEKRWNKGWYNNLMSSNVPIFAYEATKPEKFDMSKITFKESRFIEVVLNDIENRSGNR